MTRHRPSPRFVLIVVAFGVFIAADDLTVASTMLRQIIDDLHIVLPDEIDRAAWIVNAYLIAYVAVMPFAGRLSDIWGRRRVFVAALGVFAVGSVWIPLADSLGPMLVGRVLTAVGGGAMVPVALAVVGDVFPAERRGRAFGALAAIDTLGWVWGPMFGALLVRFLEWRWQFYLNVPLALLAAILAMAALRDVGRRSRRRLDLPGAAALSVALVAVSMGLLLGARLATTADLAGLNAGGGVPAWPLLLVAAAALVVLIFLERRAGDPLLDAQVLSERGVSPSLGANLMIGAVLAVALVNVPLFVNLVLEIETGRAALLSGWILTGLTASMALAAPAGGWMTDRVSGRAAALAGTGMAVVGLVAMGLTWGVGVGKGAMALHLAVLGAGVGLATPAVTEVVVAAAPLDRRGVGASLVIIARLVGITLGLAGLTAWALHRFDQLRQGVTLPPLTDPGYQEALASAQASITGTALRETFLAAALGGLLAVLLATRLPARRGAAQPPKSMRSAPE